MKYYKCLLVLLILFLPSVGRAYDYINENNESSIKQFRKDVYHLRDLYDELIPEEDNHCTTYGTVYAECKGVTVKGAGTYSLEDYVAGVLAPEFGNVVDNEEAAKAYGIAIRTFVLNQTNNCKNSIESSSNKQNFDSSRIADYRKYAQLSEGQVATNDKGLFAVSYALSRPQDCEEGSGSSTCTIKRCYTWVDSMANCKSGYSTSVIPTNILNWSSATHFGGIEAYIVHYLAVQKNYTADQIIKHFYGENVGISMLNEDGSKLNNSNDSNESEDKNNISNKNPSNSCVLNEDEVGEYVNVNGVSFPVKNYNIEGTSKGLSKYYNFSAGNVSQCPWYAKYRAIEIVMTSSLSKSLKTKARAVLTATGGNGNQWYAGTNSTLKYFKYTSDITKPKAGSIVSWEMNAHSYGHVGIIEKVYSDGSVLVSEGWNRFGAEAANGVNSIKIITRKMTQSALATYDGKGKFKGYTYLFSYKE